MHSQGSSEHHGIFGRCSSWFFSCFGILWSLDYFTASEVTHTSFCNFRSISFGSKTPHFLHFHLAFLVSYHLDFTRSTGEIHFSSILSVLGLCWIWAFFSHHNSHLSIKKKMNKTFKTWFSNCFYRIFYSKALQLFMNLVCVCVNRSAYSFCAAIAQIRFLESVF